MLCGFEPEGPPKKRPTLGAVERVVLRPGPAGLTAREREIASLASRGLRNKEIARELGLAEGTVKFQMHIILKKLAMKKRAELILRGLPR